MTPQELWHWWFAKTGAPVRDVGLHDAAVASRTMREAALSTPEDADQYYDWLSSWYSGVDIPAMLKYADRWVAQRSTQSNAQSFIAKHGGRW